MLKRTTIISFILFFIINICNPLSSSATTTGTVYLDSNKTILEENEEVEVSFDIEGQEVVAYNAIVYFDETKVDFVSGPENINVDKNRIIIVWHDTKGGSGAKKGELAKFVFKAKDKGTANFVIEGGFFNKNGQSIQTKFEQLQVQIGTDESSFENEISQEQGTSTQSSNANLQSLRVNIEGMVPNFQSDIYEYDLTVSNDINNIEVLGTTENPNAKVEITGNTGLKEGLNIIKLKVTSEDLTQSKEYIIKVTKTANVNLANTNLETLAIENAELVPPFDNNITQYNTQISNEITDLRILAIPENEAGKAVISGDKDLKEGNNTVTITVTAPNGFTTRVYKINVYKRNAQEEEQFKQEQEEQKDKLEQAYEIEKTSTADDEEILEQSNKKTKYFVIGGVAILVIALVIIIYYRKKKKFH